MTGADYGSAMVNTTMLFFAALIIIILMFCGLSFWAGIQYERHHPKIEIHYTTNP